MIKISYLDFLKETEYFLIDPSKYTYCLGGCGELAQSDRIKALFEWYYSHGYKDKIGMTYNEWCMKNYDKQCFDCSGFIDYFLFGEHKLSSWDFGEMPKNESLSLGVEGSILWKKGHVGIDIGKGYFIHFPNWNRSIEFGKISEYDWTSSHLCKYLNYEGASNK